MKAGDLVKVTTSGFNIRKGNRGLITEIIEYTRYGNDRSGPVPSAIVLFSEGTVIVPLRSLEKISESRRSSKV